AAGADRILAAPGSKTYGRLSVIAQATSRPARAFDLPARAFTPPPKVDSSVVVFSPPPAALTNIAALERVTLAAFSQRRKMLRQSLKSLWGGDVEARLYHVGVRPTDRAEDISVEKFIELARG
ncbi:MAG: rRNA adenine N-6-methyltransferase family protein, partial [Amphiplicatus sp.]